MPQFADEFTSEPESPAVRLRRRLQGRIGGIAPGVAGASPSNAAVPRSSLPIWVQDRLRQQEEERRRQGAALPRAPLPRPLPTPRNPSTATLLRDELLLEPRTSEERLRAILDSPVRGTGAGVGRISLPVPTPAAPPRPTNQPLSEEAEEAVFAEASAQEQQAAAQRCAFGLPRAPRGGAVVRRGVGAGRQLLGGIGERVRSSARPPAARR